MKTYNPGGGINPNSRLNVRPGFSKGEPGGAPDTAAAPKAPRAARAPKTNDVVSGLDRALSNHADKMHPTGNPVDQ